MSGSYGNCSKCGRAIDDSKLDLDPALALCLDCSGTEPGAVGLRDAEHKRSNLDDILLENLNPFDAILLGRSCEANKVTPQRRGTSPSPS
jgi:hypothetical protein